LPVPGENLDALPGFTWCEKAREGFLMNTDLPDSAEARSSGFQRVLDAFLVQPGLPFADVLSAERIEQVFAKHHALFGTHGVYSTAVMVWSFLAQVLRDGKEAACQAGVARVVSSCLLLGEEHRLRTRVTIAGRGPNFQNLRCAISRAKWPMKWSPQQMSPGCGKACTRS
jgi:hypothetical protein